IGLLAGFARAEAAHDPSDVAGRPLEVLDANVLVGAVGPVVVVADTRRDDRHALLREEVHGRGAAHQRVDARGQAVDLLGRPGRRSGPGGGGRYRRPPGRPPRRSAAWRAALRNAAKAGGRRRRSLGSALSPAGPSASPAPRPAASSRSGAGWPGPSGHRATGS